MNKEQFLSALRGGLAGLPEEDIQSSLDYYAEMIDDRMEDGKTEEEAVSELGDVKEIVSQILMEIPLPKLVRAKTKPKRALRTAEIVLIVLGFPLWFSLIVAAIAIVLSVYIVFWSLVISFYAVAIALGVSVIACLGGAVTLFVIGNAPTGIFACGAAFVLIGIAILLFLFSLALTRGVWWLGKQPFRGLRYLFVKGSDENA